jgi:Protein of unknown function (DUF4231)
MTPVDGPVLSFSAEAHAMTDPTSPTLQRLDDQIAWYDKKSQHSQFWFKRLKLVQIVTAGIIPLLGIFSIPYLDKTTAVLGLVILVVEGLQQLNQYQTNWISYRATCEALRHEKYLFLAGAGPYANAKPEQALPVLADRIEGLISQEHAKWLSAQQQPGKRDEKDAKSSG